MAVLSGWPYNYVIITPEKEEVWFFFLATHSNVTCGKMSFSEAAHSRQNSFVDPLE